MKLKSEIIEQIYDVPLGQSTWLIVMQSLQREMSAELGVMFLVVTGQPPQLITTTPNDAMLTPYNDYFGSIDPWNEVLDSRPAAENFIQTGESMLPRKQFQATEYYNDFWKIYGLGETIGGRIVADNGVMIQIGLPRGSKADSYTSEDSQLLRFYSRHIKRAIELEGYLGLSLPTQAYEFGLNSCFGLTVAEAKLARNLLSTSSLKESATELNRSYHTVRTQIKSIYHKTETNNQLQLFKRLLSPEPL